MGLFQLCGSAAIASAVAFGAAAQEPVTWENALPPGTNVSVHAVAPQVDGKILVGGSFSISAGVTHQNIARFHADGVLDESFAPEGLGVVKSLAVLPDGKILVGGPSIRLHADGTRDTNFNAAWPFSALPASPMAVQANGKIITFGFINPPFPGPPWPRTVRLNADGSFDQYIESTLDLATKSIVMLPGGIILLTGNSFYDPGAMVLVGGSSILVHAGSIVAAAQADGKILLGGAALHHVWGASVTKPCRLTPYGASVDPTFAPSIFTPSQSSQFTPDPLVVQLDGKILVRGEAMWPDGRLRTISRLTTNGSLDASLDLAGHTVHSLLADGSIFAGFWTNDEPSSLPQYRLKKLPNTSPTTERLAYNGSTIIWRREGSGPEAWHATFEHSTNGVDWLSLGTGTFNAGQWQLTNVTLSAPGTLRARGLVAMGGLRANWVVETIREVSALGEIDDPVSQAKAFGSSVLLSVPYSNTEPLNFQWLKDGVPLVDGGNISGATTRALTISNLSKLDEAGYSLVYSRPPYWATSRVATLTVIDPAIVVHPVSRYSALGSNATFTVEAAGSGQLAYQWLRNGSPVPGGTGSSLILTNLHGGDSGGYTAVVSNQYGSTTSQVAQLTMNLASVETSFNPTNIVGFYYLIDALAVQADGKILVSGYFRAWQPSTSGPEFRRMNADGTYDSSFTPPPDVLPGLLSIQPDGKILALSFNSITTTQQNGSTLTIRIPRLLRLNRDGLLDTTFNTISNVNIQALLLQPDGGMVIGGSFTNINGTPCKNLARLDSTGLVDTNFNAGANGPVTLIAGQTDGKMVLAGTFTSLEFPLGVTQTQNSSLGRIGTQGQIDAWPASPLTFAPGIPSFQCLLVEPDGSALVGGSFICREGSAPTPAAPSWTNLVRILPAGVVDKSFTPMNDNSGVITLALQTDGKIIVGGTAYGMFGSSRSPLQRLLLDGSIDESFVIKPLWNISTVAIQDDGKMLVGSLYFRMVVGNVEMPSRIQTAQMPFQSLETTATGITWLRSGPSPEVWRTTFDYSLDGQTWHSLGAGTRIPGGWTLTGANAPPNASVRARGFVAGGNTTADGWFVEYPPRSTPIVLRGTADIGPGGFEFQFSAYPGQLVIVDASTNLVDWVPIQTNTVTTNLLHLSDPLAPQFPARYYRARTP